MAVATGIMTDIKGGKAPHADAGRRAISGGRSPKRARAESATKWPTP